MENLRFGSFSSRNRERSSARSPYDWLGAILGLGLTVGIAAEVLLPSKGAIAQSPLPQLPSVQQFPLQQPQQFLQLPVPAQQPPFSPGPIPPFDLPPAPPPLPALPSSKRYVVYIPTNNPVVLAQVQLIEPEAFIKEWDGKAVIQAGMFLNNSNAYRRARELELLVGIRSAIATIEPISPAIATAVSPGDPLGISNPYFVVIPGNANDFSRITTQLTTAGIAFQEISVRTDPFGPHLAIGPYPNRITAQQESGYIRNFGIDARVHQYD
ncbi:hypothetical protein [Laspinema olomoucense]|uniref:SPOR domain-containing protein n=1 Tax=Laspinema olomoucense D3b TaxID=2953688 RepID=A0ABT2N7T4_9CYAN|nr:MULTISPECIES: hypothetical protein [unclassified Laspinema]MCT7977420.1 hypothetical protein [Laspinema sp. D3b]MCT7986839.1 hypothetical protein [Laspinema sp. D3a]